MRPCPFVPTPWRLFAPPFLSFRITMELSQIDITTNIPKKMNKNIAKIAAAAADPLSLPLLSRRPLKRMRLGIQHPLIQTDDVGLREEQVVVLERLGEPEALHLVLQAGLGLRDVVDGAVGKLGAGGLDGGLEHAPALVHPFGVAGDAVHVPYGFYGFGAGDWF